MCKIIHFQPGQMLPVDMLENAIANNWHGYGLIVKTPKKLTVLKKVPNDFDNPETYRDWETDRKSTRLNSSHSRASRMPSSA